MDSQLTQAVTKKLPTESADYHLQLLRLNPAGEWFKPTNGNDETYTVCQHLTELNLICSRRKPLWRDGRLMWLQVEYLYSEDLNYKEI